MNLRARINDRRQWWAQLPPWGRFSVAAVTAIYIIVVAVSVLIALGGPRVENSLQWDIGPDESVLTPPGTPCTDNPPGVCPGGAR